MKRRDLLKGLLAIPAALVGAKAVKAEPKLLEVTNLHTPRGKKEWLKYDASTGEQLVFEPVTLKLKHNRWPLYISQEQLEDCVLDMDQVWAEEFARNFG